MSAFLVSLIFGAGVAGWVWSKVGRRTGNANPTSVTVTAGGAGLVAFVVLFTLMKFMLGIA